MGETDFDVEFMRYRENEGRFSLNNITTLLRYFLELCKDFNIKIIRAGMTDYSLLPREKEWEILDELDEDKNKLLHKISKRDLSTRDINTLLDLQFPHKIDVLNNLTIEIEYGAESVQQLRSLLNNLIRNFTEGKIGQNEFFEASAYTYLYQKSSFLEKLPDLIKKYGYSLRLSELRDASILGEDISRVKFLEVFLGLEYEGYLEITELNSLDPQRYNLKDTTRQDLVLDIKLKDSTLPRNTTSSSQAHGITLPPANWDLIVENKNAHLSKEGHVLFTFPSNTSNQFRYFKCLWNNYGKRVTYQEVYEFESNLKHPNKRGKNWKFNDLIRNSIQAGAKIVKINLSLEDEFTVLEFSDNGIGIAEENIPKIFEPFFTTKKEGKGTGLGLWVSYGIIKSFQGEIKVSSIYGQSTTFTISLPVQN